MLVWDTWVRRIIRCLTIPYPFCYNYYEGRLLDNFFSGYLDTGHCNSIKWTIFPVLWLLDLAVWTEAEHHHEHLPGQQWSWAGGPMATPLVMAGRFPWRQCKLTGKLTESWGGYFPWFPWFSSIFTIFDSQRVSWFYMFPIHIQWGISFWHLNQSTNPLTKGLSASATGGFRRGSRPQLFNMVRPGLEIS